MKRLMGLFAGLMTALSLNAGALTDPGVVVSDLSVKGRIEGENIVFDLDFTVDVKERNVQIPLAVGDLALYQASKLPGDSTLTRDGARFLLKFGSRGKQAVSFRFASRPVKDNEWRSTSFSIPMSNVRRLLVECDRDDLEIRFPGALRIERQKNKDGKTEVTAFLGLTDRFEVRWKPEVKKLAAEATVECQANTIAISSVGAMRLNTIYSYRIAQGVLNAVHFSIPKNLNITQVRGADIREWTLEKKENGENLLTVTLSRPKEDTYRLQIEGETVLTKFPCQVSLPVATPKDSIRTSGFLMIGADSAIKLLVKQSPGLTQVDQLAFPQDIMEKESAPRTMPTRSVFTYQYANMPYTLEFVADDIVSEYSADHRLVLSLADNDLVFSASTEIDVRDSGAREFVIETDPGWIVASVTGTDVSDHDIREEGGKRLICVYLRQAALGRVLLDIRLEQTLADKANNIAVPAFKVRGAKTERGHIVLAAEKGLRLKADKTAGVHEVHTGSTQMNVVGAQQAFRFKESGWSLTATLERTAAGIHAEVFHLVSIGEGVLYESATMTYHISGAPARSFVVFTPEGYQNVEFTGRGLRSTTHEGNKWTITLQDKVMGDYTLLATYDRQFDYRGGDVAVGGLSVEGAETEMGYIALASSANLDISELDIGKTIIRIDPDEIPSAYKPMINAPVLKAYKYVKPPHLAQLKVARLDTSRLLTHVVDNSTLFTTISRDGDIVTTATYSTKNAAEQYLVVKLPPGVAKAWSTKVMNEDGLWEDVPSRQQKAADNRIEILIPLRRPQDPNSAMKVEVVYPEAHKLAQLGGSVRLSAPTAPLTQATFVRWTVQVPPDRVITAADGNMQPDPEANQAIRGVNGANLLFRAIPSILAAPWHALRGDSMSYLIRRAVHYGEANRNNSVSFTETLTLSDSAPLALRVDIAPLWVGPGGSLTYALLLLATGIIITILASTRTRKAKWLLASGLTVCVFGLSRVAAGRLVAASAMALIAAVIIALILMKLIVLLAPSARRSLPLLWRALGFLLRGADYCLHAIGRAIAFPFRRRQTPQETDTPENMPRPGDDSFDAPPFEPAADKPAEPGDRQAGSPPARSGGYALVTMLTFLFAALALASVALATTPIAIPEAARVDIARSLVVAPPEVVMNSVQITVQGPGTGRDEEKSASVEKILEFDTSKPVTFTVIEAPGVLTNYDLGSRYARIASAPGGYVLQVEKKGTYRIRLNYLVPVSESNGIWSLNLSVPRNMRNSVTLTLPETGMDVACDDAVHFRKSETETATEAVAVFGPAQSVTFTWKPRVRKTRLEKVVYFCEVNSLASFEPGVVDVTHLIRFQIAQGELKRLELSVPDGMNITAATAPGLSTWRFDPEKKLLEAVLETPATDDFTLAVIAQVPAEPVADPDARGTYNAGIGSLTVTGATRQRGALAIASPETMQVRVDKTDGLNPMNVADFSPATVDSAIKDAGKNTMRSIKRAFRYDQLPVRAVIQAQPVLPEIKVEQTIASLSVADERILMSTQMKITVSKAGVFALHLDIPRDFEIETLTGDDVSHWDEVDSKDERIVIHFKNQALGERTINVAIARMGKGIEETIEVPRIAVIGARKHTGILTIQGEQGVRMTTINREGVSELSPERDLNIRQQGLLAFKLLRPAWRVTLKTEVIAPSIMPEVFHRVDLTEGMLRGQVHIRYRIENAGCKTFFLKAPLPGSVLAISGEQIAKTEETDKTNGIWRIDLHNKVQNNYDIEATYQLPFDPKSQRAVIRPVAPIDTDPAKGYLVIMSAGRVEIKAIGDLGGLKPEDPHAMPPSGGDMSDAVLCYRTVRPDYALQLSVVRHESADVLQARVNQVDISSVIADNLGNMLTRVALQISVGDLRFLKVNLPGREDSLWTVFVNGKATEPAKDGDAYRIPLEASASDETSTVELIYAGKAHCGFLGNQRYEGPRFNLPLNNVRWSFYVAAQREYFDYGGTMTLENDNTLKTFSIARYESYNSDQMQLNKSKAKKGLDKGEQYARQGDPMRAKKALEEAVLFAQDKGDREDARIQYKNMVKQQAKVGLVQRRNIMRLNENVRDEKQMEQLRGFNEGNYTADYAKSVQQSLTIEENEALDALTDKIIEQQAAAAGVAQAIKITVPEHGRKLEFFRPIQINPNAAVTVEFKTLDLGPLGNTWRNIWPAILLLALIRIAIGGTRKTAREN
ncbi:MAG: hypothetical protein WCL44_06545 [bacterium]